MKHIVGLSGGIDSQATALYVRRNFDPADVILINSDAGGNEHPLTEAFICQYSENVFPVVVVQAVVADLGGVGTKDGATGRRRDESAETDLLTFQKLAYIKGRFPSRTRQFCTTFLKLAPQRRWLRDNLDAQGIAYERYSGVRRDESQARTDTPLSRWDDYFQCILHCPLAAWTKQECFDYVLAAGEEINPLYRLGFNRVGCAPCVNSGKDDVREWAARFPQMIDKVRQWEAENKRTFFPPCVPGLEINWIDQVVAWSKTAHGGKQGLLSFTEIDAEAGTCVSKYGLCE